MFPVIPSAGEEHADQDNPGGCDLQPECSSSALLSRLNASHDRTRLGCVYCGSHGIVLLNDARAGTFGVPALSVSFRSSGSAAGRILREVLSEPLPRSDR